ncbi:unnamed protein product [Protopolystoma xenopodis]|uniref:Uncharacterized protein n=1 Tax=Protopolystoma xenopodis TaxID=117903 RepID=A0A448XHW6_9PLAT|nr:unnamed protein product [Protopolystoma xenopodis]
MRSAEQRCGSGSAAHAPASIKTTLRPQDDTSRSTGGTETSEDAIPERMTARQSREECRHEETTTGRPVIGQSASPRLVDSPPLTGRYAGLETALSTVCPGHLCPVVCPLLLFVPSVPACVCVRLGGLTEGSAVKLVFLLAIHGQGHVYTTRQVDQS